MKPRGGFTTAFFAWDTTSGPEIASRAHCFASSLMWFVVQPRSYPEEADWYFDLDTGSAYLLMTRKGNCELYINDMLVGCVSEDALDTSPYNELEMKEER